MKGLRGRARARTVLARVLLAVSVVGVTACGDPAAQTPLPRTGEEDTTPPEAHYACFGSSHPVSAWQGGTPAETLEHPGRETLEREVGEGGLAGWFVLAAQDDVLAVARRRTQDRDAPDDMLRTHDVVTVEHVGGDVGWHLGQSSSCAPRLVVEGLGAAEVWLAEEPDPGATRVALLVNEHRCNSGESARGRVEVVRLAEFEDRVELVLGVRPRAGGQDCQSNPDTPFTLELSRPLGERALVDAGVHPPRPLDVAVHASS